MIVNVDMIDSPRIFKHDLMISPYPWEDNEFDEVYLFHCIEHIPEDKQHIVLNEVHRVLKLRGRFALSYPEFKKCVHNYLTNYKGMREFWKATIYGRGLTEWDRHKALMDSDFFVPRLCAHGFKAIKVYPERREPYNTVVIVEKVPKPPSYEDLLAST